MKITQGSIVITAFPFADEKAQKIRPALVVSSTLFNQKSSDVWITGITTQDSNEKYKIPLDLEDIVEGEILKRSFVKFTSIAHIDKQLLKRKVAQLSPKKTSEVVKQMVKILDEE